MGEREKREKSVRGGQARDAKGERDAGFWVVQQPGCGFPPPPLLRCRLAGRSVGEQGVANVDDAVDNGVKEESASDQESVTSSFER